MVALTAPFIGGGVVAMLAAIAVCGCLAWLAAVMSLPRQALWPA